MAKKFFNKKTTVFIIIVLVISAIFLLYLNRSHLLRLARLQPEAPEHPVNHIILFIGDGMQLEHEIAASLYLYGQQMNLTWHSSEFYRLPCTTWDVTTYNQFALKHNRPFYDPASFDPILGYDPNLGGRWPFPLDTSGRKDYFLTPLPLPPDGKKTKIPAADSAAAATAIGTGYKTDEGNLSWLPGDPPDGRLKTVAEIMREQRGASIGVVSTVPFSHVTPAAFVSHNVQRSNYLQIAAEIIKETRPEVVIGGGYPGPSGTGKFNFISEADYNDLKNGYLPDYIFIERETGRDGGQALLKAAEEAGWNRKKLFALFGGADGSFEPPLPENNPGHPAIKRQTHENPLLKEAVAATLRVLSENLNGFFVMFEQGDIDWANHDNDYPHMIGAVWDLNEAVKTAIDFVNRPGDDIDWTNTLLIVTVDHANSYMRLKRDEKGKPLLGQGQLPVGQPAQYGRPGVYDLVTYSTTGHTNEPVMVYVYRKGGGHEYVKKYQGSWYPGTQLIDNTQIFQAMADAAGLKRN